MMVGSAYVMRIRTSEMGGLEGCFVGVWKAERRTM